jgi:hypothetical protein
MGEVFLAHDLSLDRKVAVKFLPELFERDDTARKRFVREARSAAALDHPYICGIHEVGEAQGKSFIVMEYLEGKTLRDRLAQGQVPLILVLAAAAYFALQGVKTYQKGKWARELAPKEIERLMGQDRPIAAARLLKQAVRYAPESRELDQLKIGLSGPKVKIQTEPPGADIYVRDYPDIEDNDPSHWILLGRSPLTSQELPNGCHRLRVIKEGFEPVEQAAFILVETKQFRLHVVLIGFA